MTAKKLKRIFWKEYRLHGQSKSLKPFVDFFLLGNGEYDKNRVLFITDHAFVCLCQLGRLPEEIPGANCFEVELESGERYITRDLLFYSSFRRRCSLSIFYLGPETITSIR
jgi:hypothetical protein